MFENIDEKTIKFALLILAVVIIFSIPFAVISNKTPSAKDTNPPAVSSENFNEDPEMEEAENTREEEFVSENENSDTNNIQEEENNDSEPSENTESPAIEPLEPLEDLPAETAEANGLVQKEIHESAEDLIVMANEYRHNKDYVKAIEAYKAAAKRTEDVTTKAQCYENTAIVYAIVKRYGSAISYAQQAYNIAPSTSRELLLARLYYKTGEVDKATRRVNNILQRDFSIDK